MDNGKNMETLVNYLGFRVQSPMMYKGLHYPFAGALERMSRCPEQAMYPKP